MKYIKLFEKHVKSKHVVLGDPTNPKSHASGVKLRDSYLEEENEQRKLKAKEKKKAHWERERQKEMLMRKQTNIIIDNFFKEKEIIEEKIKKHFGIDTSITNRGIQNPLPCAVDIVSVPYNQNDQAAFGGHTWDLSDEEKTEHYKSQGKMLMNHGKVTDYHQIDYVLGYAYFIDLEDDSITKPQSTSEKIIRLGKMSAEKIIQIADIYPLFIKDLLPKYVVHLQSLEVRAEYDQIHFQFQVRMKTPIKVDTKEVMYAINQE